MCHFNDNRHKAIRLLSKRNVTLAYYYVSGTDQTNWEELKSTDLELWTPDILYVAQDYPGVVLIDNDISIAIVSSLACPNLIACLLYKTGLHWSAELSYVGYMSSVAGKRKVFKLFRLEDGVWKSVEFK